MVPGVPEESNRVRKLRVRVMANKGSISDGVRPDAH